MAFSESQGCEKELMCFCPSVFHPLKHTGLCLSITVFLSTFIEFFSYCPITILEANAIQDFAPSCLRLFDAVHNCHLHWSLGGDRIIFLILQSELSHNGKPFPKELPYEQEHEEMLF